MKNRIVSGWSVKPAGRPVRPAGFALLALAGLLAVTPAQPALAAGAPPASERIDPATGPQWITSDQRAATRLIALLQSADFDGLDPKRFKTKALLKALRSASGGSLKSADRANLLLDRALVEYVAALRSTPSKDWAIVDRAAIPAAPSASALLAQAAAAPSLERWLDSMPFMHPDYAVLRRALAASTGGGDARAEAVLRVNLNRVRLLPAAGRYVLVNIAAQRLYMFDGRQQVDSMKVVVGQGRDDRKTPMMAGTLQHALLNPYWNVPPDLVGDDVGIYVKKYGLGYLKSRGYQVLSDWGKNASVVDPATVDWLAVMDGKVQIRVRQLPGPRNVLGKVKYTFPNPYGVYLHDTSQPQLLTHEVRLFSGGCIRLEDAARLGQWLFGRTLKATSDAPDIEVPLDKPVPIYVAYLTAVPDGTSITYFEDVYGWDAKQLTESGAGSDHVAAN
ncbi:L,D-transpeptidase family protein [Sphingomonas sp. G124]|uniref:L,D-transpeptidase family protein n=1 Tax=Sphingomonas cremea TaxID=2904799 RepID=A0A9X1QKN7_9SPHN|nr:L,D-transpeptidase family protein [Sphingomonas cremea]MCF2515473.1 L,D-transpeptidase family protein [Sphingomonas cremea]